MIINYRLSPALWIALSVVACAPPAAELTEEDRSEIATMGDRYLQALVDDDAAALASLFVEDGIRLVNEGAVTQGRAAIQAIGRLAPTGNPGGDFISSSTDNITIGGQGDLAYSWMDYDLVTAPSAASGGAEAATTLGRFLTVMRRQPDSSWLFVAVMFNRRPSP